MPPFSFFQLPLSGSPSKKLGAIIAPVSHPFNSLSRDHKLKSSRRWLKRAMILLSTPSLGITDLRHPRDRLPRRYGLSTPSLGITLNGISHLSTRILLSTPSLGITRCCSASRTRNMRRPFQLPLSGSHIRSLRPIQGISGDRPFNSLSRDHCG